MVGFSTPVSQVEHVHFEDEMFADESKVAGAKAVTDTSIVVVNAEPFRPNQVVKIGEELLLVTAVNVTSKTLTVTRGYANTTAAAVTDGAKIEVQFVEGQEGRDAREGRYKKRVRKANLTQIFDDTVEISGTAAAVSQYGIDDMYEYEKQKKQLELALQLEKAIINGIKYENGTVRQMDGVRNLVKSNVTDLAGAVLNMTNLNDSLQSIYSKGGFATGGNYEIITPSKQKRVINSFVDNQVRYERNDDKRGTLVNGIVTDFGEFPVSINENLAPDEILIVDKNRIAIKPLQGRDFAHEYLGKKGDYLQGMLVGEYTLEFLQESAHARIKGAN
ncbi:DUF5309 family protein [Bacillus sp. JJ722]